MFEAQWIVEFCGSDRKNLTREKYERQNQLSRMTEINYGLESSMGKNEALGTRLEGSYYMYTHIINN